MERIYLINWRILSVLICGIFVVGCAQQPKRQPLYIDGGFSGKPTQTITILPIVDARKDKHSASVYLEDDIRVKLAKSLKKKGYRVLLSDKFSQNDRLEMGAITEMNESELSELGPSDSQNIFVFILEDLVKSYIVINTSAKIEASAVIIDKQSKRYLWKDTCVRSAGHAGLGGALYPVQAAVIEMCISDMANALPNIEDATVYSDSRQQVNAFPNIEGATVYSESKQNVTDGFLSGDEIRSTFSGKTAAGDHLKKGMGVKSFYASDGTYKRVLADGTVRIGRWWVDGDKLCVKFGSKRKDKCRLIEPDGAGGYKKIHPRKGKAVVHFKSLEDGDNT